MNANKPQTLDELQANIRAETIVIKAERLVRIVETQEKYGL